MPLLTKTEERYEELLKQLLEEQKKLEKSKKNRES